MFLAAVLCKDQYSWGRFVAMSYHLSTWLLHQALRVCGGTTGIVLYGSECWAINKKIIQRIDAVDQWCLRRILDIRWQNLSEMRTSVTIPTSHHLHPSLSPVVSLSLGILHERMRTYCGGMFLPIVICKSTSTKPQAEKSKSFIRSRNNACWIHRITRLKKIKVAHTWSSSVGFQSWSRFLAISLQVTWVINPAVGCQCCYFPSGPQLPPQPLRGLQPILDVNSLPKTVTQQRRDCDLNPGLLCLSPAC